MADIMMAAIDRGEAGERQVFHTGVSTVGQGGDDYLCGHCGRRMVHAMDLTRIEVPMVYECGGCGGYNVLPES
ncbi:hypothetical protein [Magnetospirillum sp. UT-4]|uniref:hypothetical protein n=1 Tax=Magnetospirillum sp. UT-4 TaxID=2681467 RepID=UPI001380925C|nr:hypothetical protein [Magnetospirillum sp. UT-4]CAA7616361.1 conserved hypothetical protein [Magnetospirillum sp. UT-4]